MDNSRVHTSKIIAKALEILNVSFIFAPPYCPSLNPIEYYFRRLKIHLQSKNIEKRYAQFNLYFLE